MQLVPTTIGNILTRTGGYLSRVSSHSVQPYRGCALGNSLCGVGCYVRHHGYVTRGRPWGSFLEVRTNARESYLHHVERERRWARRKLGAMTLFLSSSTEPFPPQERRFGITASLLEAMVEEPPDALILQSHSHRVASEEERYVALLERCALRIHLSIESDRDRLPGLPPSGSPVARRFEAARQLKEAGVPVVITVAPLLPIADPEAFFARVAVCADAVVLDHFIGGDGSAKGSRTRRTGLPAAMAAVDPSSLDLEYRDRMVVVAKRHLPGRVGVGAEGFAGRYLA